MKTNTPPTAQLFPFIQRKERLKVWPLTGREAAAAHLQILADAQRQMIENIKRAR